MTMDLPQRFAALFSAPQAPSRIYLDPDEATREKTKKAYRHHVLQIPILRTFGLCLVALFVLLNNLYLVPTSSAWADFWRLLAFYTFYIVASWLILLVWYSKIQTVHLGLLFLLFDIIPFLMAIYYSGGEKSWLFFLLMVRTADQTRSTWRNTLLFANASTLGYVLLLLYLWYFEQRALSLPAELTKVCFIYASNIYLSFVAKTADYLRNRVKAAIHVSRDLIRQLEAQSSALQASERDYPALVEGSIQGVYIYQQGIVQLANSALARIFGYESPDVLIGLDHLSLAIPHERDRLKDCLAALVEGQQILERCEYEGVRRDGTFVWIECQVSNIEWRGAPAILATLQDITARRQAEEVVQHARTKLEARVRERTAALLQANEALRASETKYRTLVENIPQKIFIKDKNSAYLSCNENYALDLGIQPGEIAGLTDYDYFPEELADKYRTDDRRIMESGKTETIEERYLQKGEEIWVQTIKTPIRGEDGTVTGVLGIFWDITERKKAEEERKKLEEQLYQAQKMESVGRLAGGVAHDFNNMLGVIIGRTEMAMRTDISRDDLQHNLKEILNAGLRSADLTRQLLAFARKQTAVPKILDLNDTISGMLKMLRRLIGEDIDLHWIPGPDPWKVKIDPSQVDQILANLAVNARDAISGVGAITLRTENVVIDDSNRADDLEFIPGDYLQLTVSDTGEGMSKEVCENIFEPFFTTKEMGKGTGLGLSTVYGIVKQNDGFIHVASEPGKGATFKIHLPRFGAETAQVPSEAAAGKPPTGSETILLVEDDEGILELGKMILEMLGYTVLAVQTPVQAIHLVEGHTGDIHLLITDVVMPGMNGRELAEKLTAIRPNLKCLYMSGYTDNVIAHRGILDEGVNFIRKPFGRDDFAARVRQVLDHLE
jgi:PAS domain S-box-containing protein